MKFQKTHKHRYHKLSNQRPFHRSSDNYKNSLIHLETDHDLLIYIKKNLLIKSTFLDNFQILIRKYYSSGSTEYWSCSPLQYVVYGNTLSFQNQQRTPLCFY
jgi:hypothetical protein